jgi:hypothetical protein
MAYVPIDPGDFVPPFSASGDPYGQTWKNHGEMIDAYEQHLATCGQATATSGATALESFASSARGRWARRHHRYAEGGPQRVDL